MTLASSLYHIIDETITIIISTILDEQLSSITMTDNKSDGYHEEMYDNDRQM